MSDLCYSENLHDGDVLCWEMIKWAKEQGGRYFNMTGFDIDPKKQPPTGHPSFQVQVGRRMRLLRLLFKGLRSGQGLAGGAGEKGDVLSRPLAPKGDEFPRIRGAGRFPSEPSHRSAKGRENLSRGPWSFPRE